MKHILGSAGDAVAQGRGGRGREVGPRGREETGRVPAARDGGKAAVSGVARAGRSTRVCLAEWAHAANEARSDPK